MHPLIDMASLITAESITNIIKYLAVVVQLQLFFNLAKDAYCLEFKIVDGVLTEHIRRNYS